MSVWIKVAALCGASGVSLGAFGAHGLKKHRPEESQKTWKTGAEYHIFHSIAILAMISVARRPNVVGSLFLGGIILFSGSLYALSWTGDKRFGPITPIGGLLFICGWLALLLP